MSFPRRKGTLVHRTEDRAGGGCRALVVSLLVFGLMSAQARDRYLVCTSNEKSGDVTLIDGEQNRVIATIPVGKRPRGIHPSPDGKLLYVALSGTPISGPRIPGARVDDDDARNADHSADGIGVIDLAAKK